MPFRRHIPLSGRSGSAGQKPCRESDSRQEVWSDVVRLVRQRQDHHDDDHEMLGIDDMGTEPLEVQEFGNMHRPLTDLLTRRYESRDFTFITTNLVPQQIRKLYGDRIADRLNEMVDKIVFDNPSFRK